MLVIGLPLLGTPLTGQGTPAPIGPTILTMKWRGGLWASAAASDRRTEDGSLFLNTVASGEGRIALDGLLLGADVPLLDGWSLKFTILGGRTAQVLNDADGEKGAVSYPEAMLIWAGKSDVFRVGRMWTGMGMEVMDHTQDVAASRGLLFTYVIPFNQVGMAWHHGFTANWSTDLWLFNGEDRVKDNNRGKTLGLGVNYNEGGASDKFISFAAYTGSEQDGFGSAVTPGAEGRKRQRVCATFGWAWASTSLLGEIEAATETFADGAIAGAPPGETKARWSGAGLILKRQLNERWALFLRCEYVKDDKGVRLNYDSTMAAALTPGSGTITPFIANLRATSVRPRIPSLSPSFMRPLIETPTSPSPRPWWRQKRNASPRPRPYPILPFRWEFRTMVSRSSRSGRWRLPTTN